MKKPINAPLIQTRSVRFFNLEGKMIALLSINSQEIKAPKNTEKLTSPAQDLAITPHPSLIFLDPDIT